MPLAIVIPARNEAAVIGQTVADLRQHIRSGDAIIVVDDDSEDNTAEIAEANGARVFRRPHPSPPSPVSTNSLTRGERGGTGEGGEGGKGAALKWWIEAAGAGLEQFDAIVILDADTRVDAGFLDCIRDRISRGAQVVQAFIVPIQDKRSPLDALAAYSALLEQSLDDRLRAALGWPVRLRGTGMAFRPAVLRWLAPQLRTHVEDVEMSLLLAARGLPVTFAPEARVFDPPPATDALAARQRARWLRGQWAVWKLYRREIAQLLLRGPWAWSLVSSLLLKPKSLLLPAKALLGLAALTLWPIWPPVRVALGLLALSLLLDAAYYVIGLAFVENGSAFLLRLPLAPIFPVLWLRGASLALDAASTAKGWLRARQ